MTPRYAHPLSKVLNQRPQGPMRSPARALGWFSIGLGLFELLAPRTVSRMAGLPDYPTLVRIYGLREIAAGVGLLTARDPAPWLWGRVAGDVVDIATAATGLVGPNPGRAVGAIATLGAVASIDIQCAAAASKGSPVAVRDYSMRSGFPRPVSQMRGAARTNDDLQAGPDA